MSSESTTRRTVLTTGVAAAGAAAGAVALAACGSGGGSSSADASAANPASAAPGTTSGTVIASVSDVAVGQAKSVTVNGHPAIVARPSENEAVAFSAICTHQGCTVVPSGDQLNCPCHRSQFNAFTGAVQRGPAQSPLPAIAVKVENGQITTT
jgi:Rieske Fe-S protein